MTIDIDRLETLLVGRWLPKNEGGYVADDTCRRIEALVHRHLKELGRDASGWDALYLDPNDGRYWELIYPASELPGGGPPELRCLSVSEARLKYGDGVVGR